YAATLVFFGSAEWPQPVGWIGCFGGTDPGRPRNPSLRALRGMGPQHSMAASPRLGQVRAHQPGEGALAAVTGRVQQTVLTAHGSGPPKATPPATGRHTPLPPPDGPPGGSSSTAAPSRRAWLVASSIRSTSAYGSHSGRRVWHSMIPPPTAAPRSRAK